MSEIRVVTCHKVTGILMKVCIPTGNDNGMEGIVEQHFGKAPTHVIMDTDQETFMLLQTRAITWGTWDCLLNIFTKCRRNYALCGNQA